MFTFFFTALDILLVFISENAFEFYHCNKNGEKGILYIINDEN